MAGSTNVLVLLSVAFSNGKSPQKSGYATIVNINYILMGRASSLLIINNLYMFGPPEPVRKH